MKPTPCSVQTRSWQRGMRPSRQAPSARNAEPRQAQGLTAKGRHAPGQADASTAEGAQKAWAGKTAMETHTLPSSRHAARDFEGGALTNMAASEATEVPLTNMAAAPPTTYRARLVGSHAWGSRTVIGQSSGDVRCHSAGRGPSDCCSVVKR